MASSYNKRASAMGPTRRHVTALANSARAEGHTGVPPSGTPGAYAVARTIPATNSSGRSALFQLIQNDTSAMAMRPRNWTTIRRFCDMQLRFQASSGNTNTERADWGHWRKYWVPYCLEVGSSHWREDPDAAQPGHLLYQREVSIWAWFLMFVWERIKPRSKRDPHAKPASAHQVLLAIRRRHKLRGLKHCLPRMDAISMVLRGMTAAFRDQYGPEALLPARKEPIPYSVVDHMLMLQNGEVVGKERVDSSSFLWHSRLGLIAVMKVSGERKSSFAVRSGEEHSITDASRATLVWLIDGDAQRTIMEPSLAQLRLLKPGDVAGLSPSTSKADQMGDKYGNFLIYLKLDFLPTNAAYRLLQIEINFPVQSRADRKRTPLFGPTLGRPFTFSQLDAFLANLLKKIATERPDLLQMKDISRYSWHSFRISLACSLRSLSLHDKSIDDATIQAFCRWATPDSLKVYARLSVHDYADIIDKAGKATFNSVQAATLWKDAPYIDDDHRFGWMESLANTLASSTD